MKSRPDMNEERGLYLGTEIDEKWWRRYTKDKLFARGNGKYWYDDKAFYFLRDLTEEPITIPLKNIIEFKIGRWHGGRWCCGYPVLKIIWLKDGLRLSSGFLISKEIDDVEETISRIQR